MFENNSKLVRQFNIFTNIFVYSRNENIDIPTEFDQLSETTITEFKKYDSSEKFVFDVYHLHNSMYLRQFVATMSALPNAMNIANFGTTKERNKHTIHRASGLLAANTFINNIFGLDNVEPYLSVLNQIPSRNRSDYILHFAACFSSDENAEKFKQYLTKKQVDIFNQISAKTKAISLAGDNLFAKKETLSKRRSEINSMYNETGFISLDDGAVEMMDFDKWADQNGHLKEYEEIAKSLENLSISLEDIIRRGMTS